MKVQMKFFALSILVFSAFNSVAQVEEKSEMTASTFIKHKLIARSGGAGNGGSVLISDFFREALVGLNELVLTKKIDDAQKEKINLAMKSASVFPVEFKLCDDDANKNCSDEEAYAAKNYPSTNMILISTKQDFSKRWSLLSIRERRRIAIHEFAGLAGIELGNHYFSSNINDERIYKDYKDKDDLKRYFKLMNDLYYLLPGDAGEGYEGEWGKKVVLRPSKFQYTKKPLELLKGARYQILIQKEKSYFLMKDKTVTDRDRFKNNFSDDCGMPIVRNGEFQCHETSSSSKDLKWKGKIKKLFSPSFSFSAEAQIASLSCKALSDDELMCRHIYYSARNPYFLGFKRNYEYSFYKKLSGNERFFFSARESSNTCEFKLKKILDAEDEAEKKKETLAMMLGIPFGPWVMLGNGLAVAIHSMILWTPVDNVYNLIDQAYSCDGRGIERFYKKLQGQYPSSHFRIEDVCKVIRESNEDGSLCAKEARLTQKKIIHDKSLWGSFR